jgi:hypothetical protein
MFYLPAGVSQIKQDGHMNEICDPVIDELNARELTIDELDAVSGGSLLNDIIDRAVAIYHFCTGTITSHATTLP